MKQKRSSSSDSFYDTTESPIGILYLVFTGKTLRGIVFKKPDAIPRKGEAPPLIKKELKEYFENCIIESNGSIDGYSQGIDIKKRLLEIEYYINGTEGWYSNALTDMLLT